jgi:hypothetical protein
MELFKSKKKIETLGTILGRLSANDLGLLAQRPCRPMPWCVAGHARGGAQSPRPRLARWHASRWTRSGATGDLSMTGG